MNNDSPSTDLPSSAPATVPATLTSTDPTAGASDNTTGGAVEDAAVRSQDVQPESPAKKRAVAQTKKKFEFINNLTLHLDILIYAELCILYYMEFVALPMKYCNRIYTKGGLQLLALPPPPARCQSNDVPITQTEIPPNSSPTPPLYWRNFRTQHPLYPPTLIHRAV